jgi:hypothetical protein
MWTNFKTNFAWVIFATIGVFFIYLGILDSIFGELLDPIIWSEIQNLGSESVSYASLIVRVLGYTMISFGALIFTISVKSYRNREQWAWIALWIVPCFLLLVSITVIKSGGIVWIIEDFILVISILAQILSFPVFFNQNTE